MRKTVTKATWCQRSGTSTVYHLSKTKVGKRIVVQIWDDLPHVAQVRVMSGSFWRAKVAGIIFEEVSLYGYTEDAIVAEVYRMARKHFKWNKS